MSQYVYSCACGWRGMTVGGSRLHRGAAPASCGACGGSTFTVVSENHPRITRLCACGQSFLSTSRVDPPQCARCRGAQASRTSTRRRYHWTPEKDAYLRRRYDSRVKGRTYELAKTLGWPRHEIKKHARVLGLTHPCSRRDFTAEETAFVDEWTGTRSSKWIAKRLKRSETSVVLKQKRMGLSRRVRDGYTMGALSECFGVDHHSVDRWIREGKLKATRRDTESGIWKIIDQNVKTFVRNHPTAFRLDKVSQEWFLDLVLGSPAPPVGTLRPSQPAVQHRFLEELEKGETMRAACAAVGLGWTTLFKWLRDDVDFRDQVEDVRKRKRRGRTETA